MTTPSGSVTLPKTTATTAKAPTSKVPSNQAALLDLLAQQIDENTNTAKDLSSLRDKDLELISSLEYKLGENTNEDVKLNTEVSQLQKFQGNVIENKLILLVNYLLVTRTLVLDFVSLLDNPLKSPLFLSKLGWENVTHGEFYRTPKGISIKLEEYKMEEIL